MQTHGKQRGFISLPRGFFETLFVLAAIGVVALIGLVGYGLWWLFTHVQFVA